MDESRRSAHRHPAAVDRERAFRLRRPLRPTSPAHSATRNRSSGRTRRSSIGGRSARLLRVVAEHADLWNVPGDDLDDAIAAASVRRYCAEVGRDPASITRSIFLSVSYYRTRHHPRCDRPRHRRGLPARRARAATPTRTVSRVGRRRTHQHRRSVNPAVRRSALSTLRSNGSRRARASAESGARYGPGSRPSRLPRARAFRSGYPAAADRNISDDFIVQSHNLHL